MTKDEFAEQLGAVRERVDVLRQRLAEKPEERTQLMPRVFEELDINLEELSVAEEELRQTNEELVAAQQTIAAERQRYQNLFDSAPDAYLVTDLTGTIQQANLAAARFLNIQKEFLVGKPITVFVDAAQQSDFFTRLTRAQRGEEVTSWDMLLQPRDRPGVPVSMHVNTMRDAAGKVSGLRWIARDISRRRQAEEQLREQKELYEHLLQAQSDVGDGVAITRDSHIIYANEAMALIYGYRREELLALPSLFDLVAPEERAQLADLLRRNAGGEVTPDRGETTIVRKDGTRAQIEFVVKTVQAGGGTQFISISRDITARKKATEALQASEEKFRGLIESAPDALVITDGDGLIRIANSQTEKLFGYTRAELQGHSVETLIPERFHVKHLAHRAQFSEEPQARAMGAGLELFGRRKDGSEFPIDISLSPLTTEEGVLIMADIRDITERMRTEAALLKTREQAIILQGVSDGITAQDASGRLIFANGAAARLLGYASPQELLAAPVTEILEKFHVLDEDGQPFPPERFPGRIALQGGQPGDVILRFRVRAGGEEHWSLVNASAVRDEKGRVLFAVNIFHDITERRRSGETILRLAAVVQNSDDAIFARSLDGIIQTWNPAAARLFGYAADEIVGKSCAILFPAERLDDFTEITARLTRGESTVAHDTVRVRKDGRRVHVSLTVSAIKDSAGRVIGGSTIAGDITERKRAEESQRFLAESGRVLSSSLDYEETLASVARLAVPEIGDWCGVDVLTEGEELKRVAVSHVNPDKVKWAYELQERYPPDPNAPTGIYNVLRTGKTEFVPEITNEMIAAANPDAEALKVLDELQLHSFIIAPMIARGQTLGAISFVSAESKRRYGAADVALAEELAARAALAIDNARLYNRARQMNEALEARVQQRTLELQASNQKLQAEIAERQSALQALEDSESRFRLVVQRVEDYAIYLLDPEGRVASWNEGAERIKGYTTGEILGQNFSRFYTPEDMVGGLPQRVLAIAADQGRFEQNGWRVRKNGTRFWANTLLTALRDKNGKLEGYVKITRDITARRRLEEERAHRTKQLQDLAEAAPLMHAALAPDAAVKVVAEKAREIIGTHQAIAIFTGDAPEAALSYRALSDKYARYWTGGPNPVGLPVGPIALPNNRPARLSEGGFPLSPAERAFAAAGWLPPMREWLVVPMVGYARHSIGQIQVSDKMEGGLNADDEAILVELAHAAAVAIENAQLLEEVAASRKNLRILTGRLIDAEEDERRRIARELHDEFGQRVTGLRMQLDLAARSDGEAAHRSLVEAQSEVAVLLEQVRALSLELRPAVLDDLGLLPALLTSIERYRAYNKIQVDFRQRGLEGQRFTQKIETAVFRVVQESLTNVARHAQTKEARVRVEADSEVIRVRIEDHGIGFDPTASGASASTGLPGMRERVLFLGGQFVVESAPGQGTRVFAEIPLQAPEARPHRDTPA